MWASDLIYNRRRVVARDFVTRTVYRDVTRSAPDHVDDTWNAHVAKIVTCKSSRRTMATCLNFARLATHRDATSSRFEDTVENRQHAAVPMIN
jgi:hypothetical protein